MLLVGAGGAGSAIAIALLQAGVRELMIQDADELRVATLLDLLSDVGRARVSAGAARSHRLPPLTSLRDQDGNRSESAGRP